MTARPIRIGAKIVLLGAALAFASMALGQQRTPQSGAAGRGPAGTQKQALEAPAGETGGRGADSELRQRVDQLEEQFVDLQIVVGTLESLAKPGGGAAPPSSASAGPQGPVGYAGAGQDSAHLEALETQVRALTAQLEQMSEQIRALEASLAAAPGPAPRAAVDSRSAKSEFDSVREPAPGGFGSTTVVPGGGTDAIGELLGADSRSDGVQMTELGGAGGGNPKQLYERSYGLLLQQNYAAAEAGFEDFLKRYPNDELAANAQYWLGETFFVRGQYKAAAGAFLKGSRSYSKSAKGPDSMLKLAMSLDRLGQRDAACQAYSELGARYPNPPVHIRDRVQSERQRVGCR